MNATSNIVPTATTLLVGIGSPHGDDRLGWVIAGRVAALAHGSFSVRCAQAPAQLLDWLDGIEQLEICDTVASSADVGTLYCWQWPAREIEQAAFYSSHDLSLPSVLAIAETLGRLPPRVRIWGVSIAQGGSRESLSPQAAAAVPNAVDHICRALRGD